MAFRVDRLVRISTYGRGLDCALPLFSAAAIMPGCSTYEHTNFVYVHSRRTLQKWHHLCFAGTSVGSLRAVGHY